jgi:hypothetical protein
MPTNEYQNLHPDEQILLLRIFNHIDEMPTSNSSGLDRQFPPNAVLIDGKTASELRVQIEFLARNGAFKFYDMPPQKTASGFESSFVIHMLEQFTDWWRTESKGHGQNV